MPPLKDGKNDKQFKDNYYTLIANVLKNFDLRNPLRDELNDPEQVRILFERYGWIPFDGYSTDPNDTKLKFIMNLALLSPTLSSCINGIGRYGFSGKLDLILDDDYEFDLSNSSDALSLSQDLGNTSKINFTNKLKQINLGGLKWNKLPRCLYQSYHNTGNAYLSVVLIKVLDKWFPSFQFYPAQFCRYKYPKYSTERIIGISPVWNEAFIKKNPPKEYPVYPEYYESNNEIRTIIHLKEGTDKWYGKPSWWAAALDAYMQIKNKEYLLKAVHNNFTGQIAIELETDTDSTTMNDEEARKEGYKDFMDKLEQHYTAQGDKNTSVVLLERPPGATPMHVVSFPVNTAEKYYKEMNALNRANIIETVGWDSFLMGDEVSNSFSTNEAMARLMAKLPVITSFQSVIFNECINTALDFLQFITKENYNEFKVMGKNPMEFINTQTIKQEIIKSQMEQKVIVEDQVDSAESNQQVNSMSPKSPSTPKII